MKVALESVETYGYAYDHHDTPFHSASSLFQTHLNSEPVLSDNIVSGITFPFPSCNVEAISPNSSWIAFIFSSSVHPGSIVSGSRTGDDGDESVGVSSGDEVIGTDYSGVF